MFEFCLLFLLFSLYHSENIISLLDFEKVLVFFKNGYCSTTLNYTVPGSTIFKDKNLYIRTTGLKNKQYLFIYDDYDKLKKDKEKYSFDNYFYCSSTDYDNSIFEIKLYNIYKDKTYYITFDSRAHSYYYTDTYNFTFWIYSAIPNSTISQSISFSDKKLNFLFYVYLNNKKYTRLGFKKMTNDVLGELKIIERDTTQLVHQISQTDYFEYSHTNKNQFYYIFNLTLISNSQNNDINKIYFYYFQTDENNDDTKIIYYKETYNYTKEFTVLKELYLSLNIALVPALSKVYFKYNWEYSLEDSIKAYYYNKNLIDGLEEGDELYLNKDKTCIYEKRMCEAFIRKIGRDTTSVVLKISSLKKYYNDSFNITINYGKWEEYSSGIPFYSTLMGIALCLPNIIIHILNCNKYQREHLNIIFGCLDLIFWVGFSDIISLYIYIGGYFCYYAGIVLLAIYGLLSICFYIYLKSKRYEAPSGPSGWLYFLRKLFLPLVNQAVNEYTKLQPCITVKVRSFHQESRQICEKFREVDIYGDTEYYYEKEELGKDLVRKERKPFLRTEERHDHTFYSEWGRVDQGGGKFKEKFESSGDIKYVFTIKEKEVQTWEKEQELKYSSWKDDTNFISNYDEPILGLVFKLEFNLYNDTENDLKNLKSELSREAKEHDTKIEVNEEFTIPGFKEKIECSPKNTFLLDLLYLLIAFIFSLIGFSSIVNFFIFYEERRVDVTIIKSIASSNIYENPYKEQAILEDSINISSNNKKNNNKYGKIYEPLITDH